MLFRHSFQAQKMLEAERVRIQQQQQWLEDNNKTKFKWDPNAALRKATSNISVPIAIPIPKTKFKIPIVKKTEAANPLTDAYRSCSNCHKHVNYHTTINKMWICPDKK